MPADGLAQADFPLSQLLARAPLPSGKGSNRCCQDANENGWTTAPVYDCRVCQASKTIKHPHQLWCAVECERIVQEVRPIDLQFAVAGRADCCRFTLP